MLTAPSMIIISESSLYELVEDAVPAYHCPYTTVEFAEPLGLGIDLEDIFGRAPSAEWRQHGFCWGPTP